MNISFLTSGHEPFDDRIFYHLGRTLSENNNNVEIISSKRDLTEVAEGIELNCFAGDALKKRDKICRFTERLSLFRPDVIICSEPLTLIAARNYSKGASGKIRIIYDVTEWYPSKKNLAVYKNTIRWFYFLKLLVFNFRAAGFADSFIFGEWYKSRPYRFLYSHKPFIFISYFPDLKYIPFCKPDLQKDRLRLSYSGKISIEKGYGNFMEVLSRLARLKSEIDIDVKIIGWYVNDRDREECEILFSQVPQNVSLKIFDRQNFENYIDLIKETDIFLDLRNDDFENQHCLPIKLFYYSALGRPVIFSDLGAIRKEVEIEKFGFLVKPHYYDSIINIILNYLKDEDLYNNHCRNARSLAENNYNWQKITLQFLKFVSWK
jgi:glycosyltransferase involved in cell wall biosynthesis